MKMNKKGFTLIELLAVIVVLAIIALIATPIVMNAINTAKEGAAARSVEGYAKALESKYYEGMITDPSYTFAQASEAMTASDYNGATVTCASQTETADHKITLAGCSVEGTSGTYRYASGKAEKE